MVIGNPLYDWRYESEPEPFMGGRRIAHARGRLLGGSSSINGMIFQRGNPLDYERWAADDGMADWDFAHCLPYFKRMENCLAAAPDDPFRGHTGPLVLERGPATNPLFGAFFSAVQQAGYELTDDVNGYRQEGFAPFDRNVHRGRRLSAARAYLYPVMSRPNLTVATRAFVTKIIFDGTRAVGVEFRHEGKTKRVRSGELILSGGAINSPQLLQLSGVGAAADLSALGIDVVADLPGVGENLQDHLEVYMQYACKKPVSLYPALQWWNQPAIGAEWLFNGTGIGASNQFEAGGFIRTREDFDWPNIQYHFLPVAINYNGTNAVKEHGFQAHVGSMRTPSRGRVHAKSLDPREHPSILFNYQSTDQDWQEFRDAIRITREIIAQPALDEYRGREISPSAECQTDAELDAFVRAHAETAYHPSCSCAMGTDALSVVDGQGRVHGMESLRVVDASIMPRIITGNLNATTIMIAEKIADRIRGRAPLPRSTAAYYVAGDAPARR